MPKEPYPSPHRVRAALDRTVQAASTLGASPPDTGHAGIDAALTEARESLASAQRHLEAAATALRSEEDTSVISIKKGGE